jgi:hypothetical protein
MVSKERDPGRTLARSMIRRMSIRIRVRAASTPFVAIASIAVLAAQTPQDRSWAPTVERIPTPAAAGSAQPQLATSDRGVILSWIERQDQSATLKFSERTATGWSVARSVASGSDWFVNWADVPSVIRLTNGTLVAHWLQKSGSDAYAYDVRLSHSKDDGRSWSPSFTPHTDGTRTEHGFASLFQMPGAGLGVIWLDGREMKPESGRGGHDGPGGHGGAAGGAMSVRFATFDPAWKQTAETVVDGRVCECCPLTAAVTADGPIAAFRNRSEGEVRDIYIARFEKGKWTAPKPVYEDGWKIAACPVNGPMLSARNRDVAIAWFTVKEDQGRAFVAFSKDAGRTFGSPIRVDDSGALGRVDVELLADGSAVASWIEFAEQRAQFRIRRVDASGAKSPAITVSGLANNRASGYPRIARHGDGLVLAWTEVADGKSQVQTAIVRF